MHAVDRNELANRALKLVEETCAPSPESTIVMLGSSAYSLDNPKSDVDIHIVNSRSDRGLTLIEEKFIGKRRLEVYEWSISSLERLANSIISSSKSSWAKLPERTIDYYRQWGTPRVLRDGDHLGKLRRLFSKTLAKEITIDRLSIQAQYFAWTAELWLALGKSEEASTAARRCLNSAAQAWVTTRDELYRRPKFLGLELRRAGISRELLDRIERRGAALNPSDTIALAMKLQRFEPLERKICMAKPDGVRAFEVRNKSYLLCRREHASLLSREARSVWDSADGATEVPLDGLSEFCHGDPTIVGELHRNGLVDVYSDATKAVKWNVSRAIQPLALRNETFVTVTGLPDLENGPQQHVRMAPASHDHFVRCCARMANLQLHLDNTWEDFQGAVEAEHWSAAEYALHLQARVLAEIVLCSRGVFPVLMEEAVFGLGALEGDKGPYDLIRQLEHISIESGDGVAAAVAVATNAYEALPAMLRADELRGSHLDYEGMARFHGVAVWLKLATELGIDDSTLAFDGRWP